jgi:hypothetical protein
MFHGLKIIKRTTIPLASPWVQLKVPADSSGSGYTAYADRVKRHDSGHEIGRLFLESGQPGEV